MKIRETNVATLVSSSENDSILKEETQKMKKKLVIIDNPVGSTIQPSPGFMKKHLADYHLELAALCEFGCIYCSTDSGPGTVFKSRTYKNAARAQYPEDLKGRDPKLQKFCKTYAISYNDVVSKLESDLEALDPVKTIGKTLMFGQLVDNFGPELMKQGITRRALELVLEKTSFHIRCLSKSTAVANDSLMELYGTHPDRFVVGLSIGTMDDSFGGIIEKGTSRPTARIGALHKLQHAGIKTYGMLCPVFKPSLEGRKLETLIELIRPVQCEHIWVEPYNDRKNWRYIQQALGLGHPDYEWFERAYGPKGVRDPNVWSAYATELYTRVRDRAQSNGWIDKLKYLLYEEGITKADAAEYRGHIGKDVLLQDKKDKGTGKSQNPVIAMFDPGKPRS